jgi:hypothetical protein
MRFMRRMMIFIFGKPHGDCAMFTRLNGAILAAAIVGGAAIPAVRNEAQPASTHASSPKTASMQAYIDPLTGQLIPEPAPEDVQRNRALQRLKPDNSKLEILEMQDGTKGVLMHGQRQATVIATLADDGSVKTECIEGSSTLSDDKQAATSSSHHD